MSEWKAGDLVEHVTLPGVKWVVREVAAGGGVRIVRARADVNRVPVLWRVPRGRLDPGDPNSMTCAEYAAKLADEVTDGSHLILPNDRSLLPDGTSEPEWQIESAPVDATAFMVCPAEELVSAPVPA